MKRLNKILLVLSCLVLSSSLLITVGHSSWNYAVNDTSKAVEKKVYAVVFTNSSGGFLMSYSNIEIDSYFEFPEVPSGSNCWYLKNGSTTITSVPYHAWSYHQFSEFKEYIAEENIFVESTIIKLPAIKFTAGMGVG